MQLAKKYGSSLLPDSHSQRQTSVYSPASIPSGIFSFTPWKFAKSMPLAKIFSAFSVSARVGSRTLWIDTWMPPFGLLRVRSRVCPWDSHATQTASPDATTDTGYSSCFTPCSFAYEYSKGHTCDCHVSG